MLRSFGSASVNTSVEGLVTGAGLTSCNIGDQIGILVQGIHYEVTQSVWVWAKLASQKNQLTNLLSRAWTRRGNEPLPCCRLCLQSLDVCGGGIANVDPGALVK